MNKDLEILTKSIETPKLVDLMSKKRDWLVENNLANLEDFKKLNSHHLVVAELVVADLLDELEKAYQHTEHQGKVLTDMINKKNKIISNMRKVR